MRITEIIESLSGEVGGFPQGSPCTIVRLAGCNCRCSYCDAKYSWDDGVDKEMPLEAVVKEVLTKPWNQVLITGGEPLLQKEILQLLIHQLKAQRPYFMRIQMETNGTLPMNDVYLVDYWVVDYKLDSAVDREREVELIPDNIPKNSWVKFVVRNHEDFDLAISTIQSWLPADPWKVTTATERDLKFAISPVWDSESFQYQSWPFPRQLADKILSLGLPVTLNLQLHKIVGVA